MWWNFIPILFLPMMSYGRRDCSKAEYERCIRIADPLVKEAHLVFPDNLGDIDVVCKTWNHFVDCLKVYTDECFTSQQRKQFNRAVESPIESVHQMCMQPSYQRATLEINQCNAISCICRWIGQGCGRKISPDEYLPQYLQHAPCIKNTIIEKIHCGPQYNLLVDQVDQGDIISKSTLCCSHDRFKQCVIRETRRLCDRGVAEGPASRFASQIIDKALSFLEDQCYNYIPNSGDCTTTPTSDTMPYAERVDPLTISTSSSEVYPWSTIQQETSNDRLPSRVTPPRISTIPTWLPSSNSPSSANPSTDIFSTQMLGSRTRPASRGRSNWPDNTPQVGGDTVQVYPEQPSTPSTRAEWATMSAWEVRGQPPAAASGTTRTSSSAYPFQTSSSISPFEVTSDTWYPAAGNQIGNEVEEPNQLGLQKLRNAAPIRTGTFCLTLLAAILITAS